MSTSNFAVSSAGRAPLLALPYLMANVGRNLPAEYGGMVLVPPEPTVPAIPPVAVPPEPPALDPPLPPVVLAPLPPCPADDPTPPDPVSESVSFDEQAKRQSDATKIEVRMSPPSQDRDQSCDARNRADPRLCSGIRRSVPVGAALHTLPP